MKKWKNLMRILNEYRFVRTVNVIYEHEVHGQLFIDRCFAMDLPQKGDAVVYNGTDYRVGTRWFDKDKNFIEITLSDL